MPVTHRFKVHDRGPALWPEHKPLSEVLELQATTPDGIWNAVYQGSPTSPGGSIFKRAWWRGKNRVEMADRRWGWGCVGRWMSWDTALKDTDSAAYTACVVGELWPDYRMAIREVYRERLEFPELPAVIARFARDYAGDGMTRGVLIEDKASGTSAYQTLMAGADRDLRGLLVPFNPVGDKDTRANQAAVWCKNDCILLPEPSDAVPWLLDFEAELFNLPNSTFRDQGDAFAQLVIYCENLIAEGWHARGGVAA